MSTRGRCACGHFGSLFGGRCAACIAGPKQRHGNVARTKRGRFTGPQTPAPNPGMNPFAPQARVRLDDRWRLGDTGAVYEFNIKMPVMGIKIDEGDYEHDAQVALEEFEVALRKKYPWIGQMYRTGRSAGWLAIEDPNGKMTKAKLDDIARRVEAGKRQFVRDMRQAWPRSA